LLLKLKKKMKKKFQVGTCTVYKFGIMCSCPKSGGTQDATDAQYIFIGHVAFCIIRSEVGVIL